MATKPHFGPPSFQNQTLALHL
ncbi:hypothetical protein CCACVL1_21897 [Corchorus capsularis]|uniref:Uncharacterized protein n=1 Tax=Corchorus capsularis TaxID=210143 RepID=A0A1R3H1P2_COCAP|nr:hypothetical protein CCACVL1_21897 [Corchorus capsularis]